MTKMLAINGGKKAVNKQYKEKWKQISWREIVAINKLLFRGITNVPDGGILNAFEKEFANFVSTKYALAQCNGTSTLHSAFFACGVGPGDEVIVPSYTFTATIAPIIHCGATPIFAEIDPNTLTIAPDDIKKRITKKTKVIVAVHIWGNVARMGEINSIALDRGIKVVEDASHAPGASYQGKPVGSLGDVGCFSLQGLKSLSAAEGGVVVTNDTELYERMLVLGHPGKVKNKLETERYKILDNYGVGLKYRANPYGLAMAMAQLKRLPELNRLRTENYKKLNDSLKVIKNIEIIEPGDGAIRGGFLEFKAFYLGEKTNGVSCKEFVDAVIAEGASKVYVDRYSCCHLLPLFNNYDIASLGGQFSDFKFTDHEDRKRCYKVGDLPVTEEVSKTIFSIPAFTKPPKGLIEQYIQAIHKVIEHLDEIRQ